MKFQFRCKCGFVNTAYHNYWSACTCQNCREMVLNPFHRCHDSDSCYCEEMGYLESVVYYNEAEE